MIASGISTPWRKTCWRLLDNGGFSTSQPSPPPANTGVIPPKGKSKGVFATFDHLDPDSDGDKTTGAQTAA